VGTYLLGALFVVLGAWVWWYSGFFPNLDGGYPGPALFPRIVALGLLLGGGGLVFSSWKSGQSAALKPGSLSADEFRRWLRVLAAVAFAALVPLTWGAFGPIPVAALIMLIFGLLSGAPFLTSGIIAIVGGLALYLLFFRLLGVPL